MLEYDVLCIRITIILPALNTIIGEQRKFTYLRVVINKEGPMEDEINERIAKTGSLKQYKESLFS